MSMCASEIQIFMCKIIHACVQNLHTVHAYACSYIRAYMHDHTCIHTKHTYRSYIYVYTYIHTCTHKYTSCMHTYIYEHIHTEGFLAYTCAHKYTSCIHTYIHEHMHTEGFLAYSSWTICQRLHRRDHLERRSAPDACRDCWSSSERRLRWTTPSPWGTWSCICDSVEHLSCLHVCV